MARIFILGNGQSIHTIRWIEHLAKAHEITLLTFERGDSSAGITTISFRGDKFGAGRYLIALPQLWFYLLTLRPNLIHAFYGGGYGFLARLSFFRNCFLSIWGSDIYLYPRGSLIRTLILRSILAKPKLVFATSHHLAHQAELILQREYIVIPFGVDCDVYKKTITSSECDSQRKIVMGTVKALDYIYGIDRLLRAFAIVLNAQPNQPIELVIAGEGKDRASLIGLANELGISDRVIFLGRLHQDQVPKLLTRLDIFLALSRSESFGVAVLEASACSVPVIVSSVGGLPEVVIDGVTGFIISDGEPRLVADKILHLICNPLLRNKMGNSGRNFVEHEYAWAMSVESLDIYIERYAGANEIKST